jgi:Family of unknown function (DUF6418)
MFILYTATNLVLAVIFYFLIYRMYRGTPYIYAQFLNLYVFSTVFISLSVLEYGFYITESLNYSFLNGATFFFLFFIIIFFLLLRVFIDLFSSFNFSRLKQNQVSLSQKKIYSVLVLIFVQFLLLILYVNLMLSPIPILSDSVNRLNFWDHAYMPFLASVLGERSIPLIIALGCVFNFFNDKAFGFLKKTTLLTFISYLFYLIMLGHKFSPIMLALFFFSLPSMMLKRPTIKSLLYYSSAGFLIGILYVVYSYSMINTGIVSEYGGALGGALYRAFILQGHVFWNTFNQFYSLRSDSWQNLTWLINNDFDGLMLSMYIVSPDLAEQYLLSGVRFTAAYPSFLLSTPLVFAAIFFITTLFLYAFILVRTAKLAKSCSVVRLFIYIFLLYFFHFGFTMGDFRFLFSAKFLLSLIFLIFIETALLSPGARLAPIRSGLK